MELNDGEAAELNWSAAPPDRATADTVGGDPFAACGMASTTLSPGRKATLQEATQKPGCMGERERRARVWLEDFRGLAGQRIDVKRL